MRHSDLRNHPTEGEPNSDAPSLHNPGVDAEDTECSSVKKVSAWWNELKKVAVQNLAVKNTRGTREKQNLISYRNKGCCGKQKSSKVEKCQGSNE